MIKEKENTFFKSLRDAKMRYIKNSKRDVIKYTVDADGIAGETTGGDVKTDVTIKIMADGKKILEDDLNFSLKASSVTVEGGGLGDNFPVVFEMFEDVIPQNRITEARKFYKVFEAAKSKGRFPITTKEALDWYAKNSWYGDQSDENNMRATKYAYFQHNMLIDEGYEADSSEYYEELNNRIEQVYPNLKGNVDANVSEPAVQRVASASVGGRQKTQGSKKNGVTFSKSEVDRLRGLKPHNMSEEAWLKSVAKEKQKIDAREAK